MWCVVVVYDSITDRVDYTPVLVYYFAYSVKWCSSSWFTAVDQFWRFGIRDVYRPPHAKSNIFWMLFPRTVAEPIILVQSRISLKLEPQWLKNSHRWLEYNFVLVRWSVFKFCLKHKSRIFFCSQIELYTTNIIDKHSEEQEKIGSFRVVENRRYSVV